MAFGHEKLGQRGYAVCEEPGEYRTAENDPDSDPERNMTANNAMEAPGYRRLTADVLPRDEMRIRQATIDDVPAIQRLNRELDKHHADLLPGIFRPLSEDARSDSVVGDRIKDTMKARSISKLGGSRLWTVQRGRGSLTGLLVGGSLWMSRTDKYWEWADPLRTGGAVHASMI